MTECAHVQNTPRLVPIRLEKCQWSCPKIRHITWATEENHALRVMLDNVHDKFRTTSIETNDRHSSGQLCEKNIHSYLQRKTSYLMST